MYFEQIISNIDQSTVIINNNNENINSDNLNEEKNKDDIIDWGEDGKPIYRDDGKVMKGPNYFKPDFSKILK